jgi:hypothetical protein
MTVMSRMSFSHGVVVTGASEAPAPSGRREAEASFPAWCREELLSGVLNHGPPQGRCPTASWAHESSAFIVPPRREAQAVEVVDDELKVLEVNSFTKGESIARLALAIVYDGDWRWWNHWNDLEEKHGANPSSWHVNYQCFLHRQDIEWSRSFISILRWSYELWRTTKHTIVYPVLDPFYKVIALCPAFLILKMNNVIKGVSRELEKFAKWKGEMFLCSMGSSPPLPEG